MFVKNSVRPALLSVVFALAGTTAAHAYGPEGLFGGRINPDSTYDVSTPIPTETAPQRGQTVLDHPRPDYDPQPISVGSFNLYPSLSLGGSYDSNIYATHDDKKSDEVLEVRPQVIANSNWSRHALSVLAQGDFDYYNHRTGENYENALVQAQGRIDIQQQTWIGLRGGYQRGIELRGSPDDAGGTSPTEFNQYSGGATLYRNAGFIGAQLDYDIRHLDYGNTPSLTGEIPTSTETRNEQVGKAKFTLDLNSNIKPYAQVAVNRRDYDNDPVRSSHGYKADLGIDGDFGGIVLVNAYAGWLSQDYAHFGADQTNDGLDFGGRVTWNVTGLTTLIADANRSVEEAPLSSFNSFMATGGSLTLTHELRRNLLVEADASYTHDRFQGNGSQTQNYPSFGGGLRWLINQNFYTDLLYNYQERTSDTGFTRNLVTLRLNMQL